MFKLNILSKLLFILSMALLVTFTLSSCTKKIGYGGARAGKKSGGATNLNQKANPKTMKKLKHH